MVSSALELTAQVRGLGQVGQSLSPPTFQQLQLSGCLKSSRTVVAQGWLLAFLLPPSQTGTWLTEAAIPAAEFIQEQALCLCGFTCPALPGRVCSFPL